MAEPEARAERIESLFPWLLHWSIADERIGGFRSDAFAVRTRDGLLVIDVVPLEEHLMARLENVGGIFLTHGNHQRSAWRFRRELGGAVYAPAGVAGLDEEPDVLFDESTTLPGGLEAVPAKGFQAASYLTYTHGDGTGVLFCGDLICHDPGGPYRFPVQPGYFDPVGGKEDVRGLLELPLTVMCAAHAVPSLDGCGGILQGAAGEGG
jgi:glyoxylase-like metal-dependent hydrolase (beta-lactamase superfamily II)